MVNKKDLIGAFVAQLENDLMTTKAAARATYEAATHEESKAENEYDTRGLEASYLAGAQAKRAAEIDEVLSLFRNLSFKEFGPQDHVQSTALVDINLDGRKNTLLIMPKGGGARLTMQGHAVQIVTPNSSLGEALLGLKVGDSGEVEVGEHVREFEVLGIA